MYVLQMNKVCQEREKDKYNFCTVLSTFLYDYHFCYYEYLIFLYNRIIQPLTALIVVRLQYYKAKINFSSF